MNSSLFNALENERRYVARELHDGVAQTSLQLGLQAGICRKLLERGNLEMLTAELAQLEERVQLASTQVKELIADMRPPELEREATLNDYLQHAIETHQERGGPPVTYLFQLSEEQIRFDREIRLGLYRIVQEALFNIRKHAQAQAVQLSLSGDGEQFQLEIADDGQGFDPAEVMKRLTEKGGAGLINLYVRARALGGKLAIASQTEQGTRLTLSWSI